jgi:hypothetical protein
LNPGLLEQLNIIRDQSSHLDCRQLSFQVSSSWHPSVLARLLDGSPRRNLSALLTKQLDTPIETEQAGVQTVPVCTYGYIYVWSLAALSVSVYSSMFEQLIFENGVEVVLRYFYRCCYRSNMLWFFYCKGL